MIFITTNTSNEIIYENKVFMINNIREYKKIYPYIFNNELNFITIDKHNTICLCNLSNENYNYESISINSKIQSISYYKDSNYISLNLSYSKYKSILSIYNLTTLEEEIIYNFDINLILYSHQLLKLNNKYYEITISENIQQIESIMTNYNPIKVYSF